MTIHLFDLTREELTAELSRRYGRGPYHAAALYREVFQQGNSDWHLAPEFVASPKLTRPSREAIDAEIPVPWRTIRDGSVTKLVTRLADGARIESVVIPGKGRSTLCVSCQVGCRMGCAFCETGRMGFDRNLFPHEIVGQVMTARFRLGAPIRNVVFMGMGEPFDNFEAVMKAFRVIREPAGLRIAPRHVTISTAGIVPGIFRLAKVPPPRPKLAVSVNAGDDATRSRLMPINRRYPMDALGAALRAYAETAGEAIFAEYVLIRGVNDAPADARALARFLSPFEAKVNLIPCNPGADGEAWGQAAPPPDAVARFARWLVAEGVFVRGRPARGMGVMAACGQLGGGGIRD